MAGVGSSPLSRGIQVQRSRQRRLRGIIPALAGNTEYPVIGDPGYSDHPRSRGEYRAKRCTFSQHIGSSPLSRGILNTNQIVQSNTRIIPALAGNTRLGKPQFRGSWDHPRSRGEYLSLVLLYSYWCGSSPLSRGIPRLDAGYARKAWIIPALAGNTTIAAVPAVGRPDHPRSRGEY